MIDGIDRWIDGINKIGDKLESKYRLRSSIRLKKLLIGFEAGEKSLLTTLLTTC